MTDKIKVVEAFAEGALKERNGIIDYLCGDHGDWSVAARKFADEIKAKEHWK